MDPIRLFSIISWIALPTVMFGGYSLLGLLARDNPWLTPFRATYFRAGHAHAGVLLVVSLLYYTYLAQTSFSSGLKLAACIVLLIGVLAQSGGFSCTCSQESLEGSPQEPSSRYLVRCCWPSQPYYSLMALLWAKLREELVNRNATLRLNVAFRSVSTQGSKATSRVRLMLCEACASGEDWRDIHIDTEVLNEIALLAQDRRARKSHHLPIVAGIVDERLHNLDITLIPRLHKIVAQSLNRSPEIGNAAYYGITANDCLGIAETKVHILRVERCKLLHIHGIDHCIVVFCQVRHRIFLLWYVCTQVSVRSYKNG